jgi:hypothetical protein
MVRAAPFAGGCTCRWRRRPCWPRSTAPTRAAYWAESAVEVDGHIEFRFANGERCRARILDRRAGGTDLELVHDRAPEAEWIDTHAGWLNVLFPPKAWLQHGVGLRNHDAERTWDQGYADQ